MHDDTSDSYMHSGMTEVRSTGTTVFATRVVSKHAQLRDTPDATRQVAHAAGTAPVPSEFGSERTPDDRFDSA